MSPEQVVAELYASWKIMMNEFDQPLFYYEDQMFWIRQGSDLPHPLGEVKEETVKHLVDVMFKDRMKVVKEFEKLVPRIPRGQIEPPVILTLDEQNHSIYAGNINITRMVCQILNVSFAKFSERKVERWLHDVAHLVRYPIAHEYKEEENVLGM